MRPLTRTIMIDGVKVDMLFTPHLYEFVGTSGVTLEFKPGNLREVYETYADLMYLAAINAWVLDGHGDEHNFPKTRGDFHAWMQSSPAEFSELMAYTIEALTGKKLEDLVKNATDATNSEDEVKKKVSPVTTGRLKNSS